VSPAARSYAARASASRPSRASRCARSAPAGSRRHTCTEPPSHLYETEAQLAERTSATAADAYWSAYDRFAGELARAGVLRAGSALDERVRTTVRGTGPADRAEPRPRLGGYFVIAVRDRAAAEAWARKAPRRTLAVEVRPHRANPHMAMMAGTAPAAP
jgi:hypothetical protein